MRYLSVIFICLLVGCSKSETTNIEKIRNLSSFATERAKVKDFESAVLAIDSAIMLTEGTNDNILVASLHYQSATIVQGADMVERSSEHLLKAIDLYATQDSTQQQQNLCYWVMMQPFVTLRDTISIKDILSKIDSTDAKAKYHYHVAKAQYFTVQIDVTRISPQDLELRDKAITHFKNALNIFDKYGDQILFYTHPAEHCYSIAVNYFYQFALPHRRDSVDKYLALTEKLRQKDDNKVALYVKDLRAWMAYFDNNTQSAKDIMGGIVAQIDSLNDVALTTNAYQAYLMLVMLYQSEGDYKTALEYEKKVVIAHEKRFNSTNQEQLRNIQARYQVEKKEADIEALKLKNRNFLIFMTLSLLAVVLVVIIFAYRRKIYKERIYQALLEAEMRRDELDNLKTSARPSLQFFDKFFDFISHSALNKNSKDVYIGKLKNIDLEAIQQQFTASAKPLTPMDRRHILCFMIDMPAADIANIFSIEISSVHMVRYRIKKKFSKNDTWNI